MNFENFKNLAIGISALIMSLAILTTGIIATKSIDKNLSEFNKTIHINLDGFNRTADRNLEEFNRTIGKISGGYIGVLGTAVIGVQQDELEGHNIGVQQDD